MGYRIHVPKFSILLIYLCSFLSLVSTLQSHPHPSIYPPLLLQSNINLNATLPQSNLTNTHPNPKPHIQNIDCLNATSRQAYPLDPDDCKNAIDLVLHDPSGVMTPHTYSWHAREPGSFGIPADWHDGRCSILLTTGIPDAVDEFRLVEVIVAAQRILDEWLDFSNPLFLCSRHIESTESRCSRASPKRITLIQRNTTSVPISKMSLGGLALVGNMKGFFVALNGPEPEGVGEGTESMLQNGIEWGIEVATDEDETS